MMARVLIVEDEETNALVASVICQGAGHEVAVARNGQEALDLLTSAASPFDVLLVDVLMPVMNGLTLSRKLRSDPRFALIPIVGVSAMAFKADQDEMRAAGMSLVMTKPYRNRDLRQVIEEALTLKS